MLITLFLLACSTTEEKNNLEPATEPTAEPTSEPSMAESVDQDPQPLELVSGIQDYTLTQMIDEELIERPVFVHTPPSFHADSSYPVLLVFHGNASDNPNDAAASIIPQYAEMVDGGAYVGVSVKSYPPPMIKHSSPILLSSSKSPMESTQIEYSQQDFPMEQD